MARTKSESYQELGLKDDEQSVGAAADAPHISPMSSVVVVPDPFVTRLNKLPNAIIKFKFCRSFNESAFSDKPGYLDDSDIIALSRVSKATHGFFRPYQLQILADKLLLKVMKGEQTEAEVILKKRPDLLEIKGTAVDYSGRMFHCTAFQYALWALDTRYMCQMMLDCLPYSPEGERIKEALLLQFLAQESVGIKYQLVSSLVQQRSFFIPPPLNNDIVEQKYYDFLPLLEALKTYADNYVHWDSVRDVHSQIVQCKIIGFYQRFVPAHVAQHYCDPNVLFDPTPKFNKSTFTRSLLCINTNRDWHKSTWFSPDFFKSYQNVGVPLMMFRGDKQNVLGVTHLGAMTLSEQVFSIKQDLAALLTLAQTRTKDLERLKERLQSPLPKPSACVIC